jgi:hypothetical protein
MKIKYSPCYTAPETQVKFIDDWTVQIDGELYEFNKKYVTYPNISEDTKGAVQDAYVKEDELYITVKYNYTDKTIWENPNYYKSGGYRGTQFESVIKEGL